MQAESESSKALMQKVVPIAGAWITSVIENGLFLWHSDPKSL